MELPILQELTLSGITGFISTPAIQSFMSNQSPFKS
jgi:hypothetical protein